MCLLCGYCNGRRAVGRGGPLANDPRRKSRVADPKRRTQHPFSGISNPRGGANTFRGLDRSSDSKNGRIRGRSVSDIWGTQSGRDE